MEDKERAKLNKRLSMAIENSASVDEVESIKSEFTFLDELEELANGKKEILSLLERLTGLTLEEFCQLFEDEIKEYITPEYITEYIGD